MLRPQVAVVLAAVVGCGALSMRAQDQVPATPTVLLPEPATAKPQSSSPPSVLLPTPSPQANAANQTASAAMPPCKKAEYNPGFADIFLPGKAPCQEQDPLQFIVDAGPVRPLTPSQKGFLAGACRNRSVQPGHDRRLLGRLGCGERALGLWAGF